MEELDSKARQLAEKLGVSEEAARAALEAAGGDLLDAALALNGSGGCQTAAYSTRPAAETTQLELSPAVRREQERQEGREAVRDFGTVLRSLLRHSLDNRLEIWHRGRCTSTVPVLILVILMVVAFWIVVPLVFVGLLLGCRYRFSGPDLGKESINRGIDQISQVVDDVKEQVKDEVKRRKRGG